MKPNLKQLFSHVVLLALVVAGIASPASGATLYVSQQSTNPVPPYADWTTAATNIQDAIDAAADGDLVLVTNGVYASGGKVMAGDLTNRVALNKALAVQSVNGPYATIILGNGPIGTGAVRCAWLTNGATLWGFSLQGGATRSTGGADISAGGGVWCASSNAVVSSCIIRSNAAVSTGGGSWLGTLNNCAVIGNSAATHGGCSGGVLRNCTIVGNSGWGVYAAVLTNCIAYFNAAGNCTSGSVLSYCCTMPLAAGTGNFTNAPLVLADGFHLADNSPCRGAGIDIGSSAFDIDGQTWNSPPAVGCDEWWPAPVIAVQPKYRVLPQRALALDVVVAGQLPATCWWSKDGMPLAEDGHFSQTGTPNLVVNGFGPSDAGGYQVAVSNEFGMVTSAVAQVVLHCVDAGSTNPLAPYSNWQTAAARIQDAIDAAADGEIVLVTNGLYAAGGRAKVGTLTNRVTLDKAVTLQSMNGPTATIIQGIGPVGSAGVRCAWLTNGAALNGFMLQGGATRSSPGLDDGAGGGVWCASSNSIINNCIIRSNASYWYGGGAYQGTMNNCAIIGNSVSTGAGGCYGSLPKNCTIVGNIGQGCSVPAITNCIMYYNSGGNYSANAVAYCCTTPLPAGTGNITNAPQFLSDGLHLSPTSPCYARGTNIARGTDIDGQLWGAPPSIGCDEWQPAPVTLGRPTFQYLTGSHSLVLTVNVVGQEPYTCFWSKEGSVILDGPHYAGTASTNLVVTDFSPADAGAYQVVVSNAFGVAASDFAQVVLHCVDVSSAKPVPPYLTWETAAGSIQEAIDAAAPGDLVLVTNGVYSKGGKVMAGNLINRVALDKALTVQSVNGFGVTSIRGLGPLGVGAVRCAWLTNGAALSGFTLEGGATRTSGDLVTLQSGGGVWAVSNAVIAGCLIRSNAAVYCGGGVYQGTLYNCAVTTNTSSSFGGGTYNSALYNCTVSSNGVPGSIGGGTYGGNLQNCVVYYNGANNFSGGVFYYCCTTPPPLGSGNITNAPQLIDSFHLASTSPCRAAGTNQVTGTDLDGQPWGVPPSVGCDEWLPAPIVTAQPSVRLTANPVGFTINVVVGGQEPFAYWWLRDGVLLEDDGHFSSSQTATLVGAGVSPLDAGNYQVIVSNAFGVVTSAVAQVVAHYVDAAGVSPVPPYTSWTTAATNIQDAIDAAQAGELVFVTNGVYSSGGKVMAGDLTNRVALDKALVVQSINGAGVTIIRGDASGTNGPLAVRCAWLTNGAALAGFTLTGGATRNSATTFTQITNLLSGGGVWGASTNALVFNCILATNVAFGSGGGAFQATLSQCTLVGNTAAGTGVFNGNTGGGAANCTLKNCLVSGNLAVGSGMPGLGGGVYASEVRNSLISGNAALTSGGGAYQSMLVNCTVVGNTTSNSVSGFGGGVYRGALTNCIVYGNRCLSTYSFISIASSNYSDGTFAFCCTAPLPSGTGNIAAAPQFLSDGIHLAASSPCRWTGTNVVVSGTDLDGQPWANPPSMGCDEWQAAPQMVAQPKARFAGWHGKISFGIEVAGQEPFGIYWSKDGVPLEDVGKYSATHTTNLVVSQFDLADAGSYQVVVSNAFGMATSQVARVAVHCVNAGGLGAVAPFTNWASASTTIQEAIDVAAANDVVLVTNGLYATGGKAMVGDQTNRIAVDKPLILMSLNGPEVTVIQGAWDPVSTNGSGAVRCAWLANGVALTGFTLQGGATRSVWSSGMMPYGGGVWTDIPTDATVNNCIIVSNAAYYGGGGASGGILNNCKVMGNVAQYGGGAYYSFMNNCLVQNNSASVDGGGVYDLTAGSLVNCTIIGNSAAHYGGGVSYGYSNSSQDLLVKNCIVYFNSASLHSNTFDMGWWHTAYSCTASYTSGTNNILSDPQLLDGTHLSVTSPCRGAGYWPFATGTDLDGNAWADPPSMGCEEVVESALVGPMTVGIETAQTEVLVNRALTLTGRIDGRAAGLTWAFGDGPAVTNASFITSHVWTNAGDYTVTFTAFNTENPVGVSTNVSVRVVLPSAPQLGAAALSANVMQFQFSGQAGVRYVMEVATNLVPPVVWQPMQTNVCTGGTVLLSDPVSTEGLRFYRVRAE